VRHADNLSASGLELNTETAIIPTESAAFSSGLADRAANLKARIADWLTRLRVNHCAFHAKVCSVRILLSGNGGSKQNGSDETFGEAHYRI
jgi:hypothetical protein